MKRKNHPFKYLVIMLFPFFYLLFVFFDFFLNDFFEEARIFHIKAKTKKIIASNIKTIIFFVDRNGLTF